MSKKSRFFPVYVYKLDNEFHLIDKDGILIAIFAKLNHLHTFSVLVLDATSINTVTPSDPAEPQSRGYVDQDQG